MASTIVLMTGANSGIGYASSKVIAAASSQYHVIMAGRSKQKIDEAAKAIKDGGIKGEVSAMVLDVTDEESVANAVKEVSSQFGRLDVLINNAGITSRNPNRKQALMENLLANTVGPVLVTEAFKDLLLKSKNPYIVDVSSSLASMDLTTTPGTRYDVAEWTDYRMTKSALNMYAVQTLLELGPKGVKVFPICPGLVRSNLRGTDEASVTAGGNAGDPEDAGRLMLDIIEGRRDSDNGKFVHKGGVYGW